MTLGLSHSRTLIKAVPWGGYVRKFLSFEGKCKKDRMLSNFKSCI
jgi:hypothetical protein